MDNKQQSQQEKIETVDDLVVFFESSLERTKNGVKAADLVIGELTRDIDNAGLIDFKVRTRKEVREMWKEIKKFLDERRKQIEKILPELRKIQASKNLTAKQVDYINQVSQQAIDSLDAVRERLSKVITVVRTAGPDADERELYDRFGRTLDDKNRPLQQTGFDQNRKPIAGYDKVGDPIYIYKLDQIRFLINDLSFKSTMLRKMISTGIRPSPPKIDDLLEQEAKRYFELMKRLEEAQQKENQSGSLFHLMASAQVEGPGFWSRLFGGKKPRIGISDEELKKYQLQELKKFNDLLESILVERIILPGLDVKELRKMTLDQQARAINTALIRMGSSADKLEIVPDYILNKTAWRELRSQLWEIYKNGMSRGEFERRTDPETIQELIDQLPSGPAKNRLKISYEQMFQKTTETPPVTPPTVPPVEVVPEQPRAQETIVIIYVSKNSATDANSKLWENYAKKYGYQFKGFSCSRYPCVIKFNFPMIGEKQFTISNDMPIIFRDGKFLTKEEIKQWQQSKSTQLESDSSYNNSLNNRYGLLQNLFRY